MDTRRRRDAADLWNDPKVDREDQEYIERTRNLSTQSIISGREKEGKKEEVCSRYNNITHKLRCRNSPKDGETRLKNNIITRKWNRKPSLWMAAVPFLPHSS